MGSTKKVLQPKKSQKKQMPLFTNSSMKKLSNSKFPMKNQNLFCNFINPQVISFSIFIKGLILLSNLTLHARHDKKKKKKRPADPLYL